MKRAGRSRPLAAFALSLAGSVLAQLGFAELAPDVPVGATTRFALGYACLVGCLLAVATAAPEVRRRTLAFALVPAALPLVVGVAGRAPDDAAAAGAVLLGLLAAGSWLGAFLGGEIEAPGHLLPVAYAASLADVCSVLAPGGPTARIVADHPEALAVLALPWSFGDGAFVPVIGVGDVVMTALFVAACRRHRLSLRRAALALAVAYGVVLALLLAASRPLPILPALSVAVVAAFPEARRIPRDERTKAIVAMAALTAIAVVVLAC